MTDKDQAALDHERSFLSDLKEKELAKIDLEDKIKKLSETINERAVKI